MKVEWKFSLLLSLVFALAFSSVAQTNAAPAAKTLTPEEREVALKSLQATRDAFLKSIAGLSEQQWKFKPAPDRLSLIHI